MNYVFKVFVAKFLNLYIEGFGGSQVQLYQGALNLQKVQLKLQTLNKLLKELLIPFTILKADIEMLKIDIPWASLTTQPIKTHISGLNVIIQYNEQEDIENLIQDLSKKQNNESKISIQDEIRKHKEIDEQVLKRFVKKLLLNLSFEIKDIQVELLIKQQYRLQVVCQQFSTSCQENLRINPEDVDQFHRELKVETFFIKLIRFKDDDISNQQLLALDQCNSYLERSKDSIYCHVEFNNFNIILDKDIVLLANDAMDKHTQLEQLVQTKLNEFKIQPIHENFIFRDITTVSKGIHLSIFSNNLFIQSQQLTLFIQQCNICAKSFLQQMLYKLSFEEIHIKYNGLKILQLTKQDSNEFSIWPELHNQDADKQQIILEIAQNQSDRMKLIEQKLFLQIEFIHLELDIQHLLQNSQAILNHVQSYQCFIPPQQKQQSLQKSSQTHIKSHQKKLTFKMNIMKNKLTLNVSGITQFQLLFQSQTHIGMYQKKEKIKNIELKHNQLQFHLFDQNQHLLVSLNGFNAIFDYFKQIELNIHLSQVQIRIQKNTFAQLIALQKIIETEKFVQNEPIQNKSVQQNELNQKKNIKFTALMERCSIDFGQCVKINNYVSFITLNIKQLNLQILLIENTAHHLEVKSNFNLWTTHPLQKKSCKITNTIKCKLLWNKIIDPNQQDPQNILQIQNAVEIKLSQLTISNLLNTVNLLSGLDVVSVIRNKTKKKVLLKVINVQTKNIQSFTLEPEDSTLLSSLYDNLQDPKDYPTYQIQLGLEINESLQFWSQAYPFHLSKQYFNKFVLIDEIDQQEHDIFLKALNNEFILTQQDRQNTDLQTVAEPTIENQSDYLLTFKTGSVECFQIEGNSKKVFHTKLTEQNTITLVLMTENQQEIKFNLKEVIQQKTVLSFNFVKIDNNFYNVLLSFELIKDPKGQYFQKVIIKPFLIIVNLLPWNFSIGNAQFINLPISVDVNMNNTLINNFDQQLDLFYANLLNNRKHASNQSQQIIINGQVTNLYYLNFLKEGKYAIEINKRHHMIMIFRNNVLVQNQMCFVICRNIYQQQIKYLLLKNKTQFNFILMKNKSRIHIYPFSDNCLEYNIQKGDKYRIFVTNQDYELMQLLDSETMTKHNLKVNKIQIQNIHIIEIIINEEKIIGKEFKISIPNVKIDIQVCDRQEINIFFDLNLRFFSDTHLDILIQNFILQFENINVINITDCFSIIEMSKSNDLNLIMINNIFFKIKDIKLNIQQQFLNSIKLLISLLRLDPLFLRQEQQQQIQSTKCQWESLIQPTFIILNMIIDPIALEINILTNMINMNNNLLLPQQQIKMRKFKPNQLKSEIVSFYLAFLITKIPTIQLLIQNLPNPLQLLQSKKNEPDVVKLPYFFIHSPIQTRINQIEYVYLNKSCKVAVSNEKLARCQIVLSNDKLEIFVQDEKQTIFLDSISSIRLNKT
ncbi:unnamed protein product [Paramecium octaurelia]|uniref:Chorein N-terminal domain-containing protein n=1 Tax=Paramecium octaurelia TaxID=43137 RepID=A0A8S1XD49_PAROT|nr:unnamed protein product [Paramecium octaurelia]